MCIDGDVQVINICPIENYLYSVISSEMNADASLQLLKSHAVISRSWLMAQMEKPVSKKSSETQESEGEYIRWFDREDHKHFHVCADDHCQRYQGITRAHNKNVVLAVNETMGEVLKYKGSICDARYSKACGGVTELFENCWEDVPHPYLQRVVDRPASDQYKDTDLKIEENAETFIKIEPEAFCNTKDEKVLRQVLNDYDLESKDFYRWKVKYSQKELSALIKERSDIDFGDILDLVPIQRGESGRIIRLQIIGTKRILTIGKELIIRRWLSKSHLYSSAFLVERENENEGIPEGFIFYGAGWGHGVGLCQIGAALMGEKGYSYKEILEHYYKNAKIEKAYS
jgi:stage II sporulation protein D